MSWQAYVDTNLVGSKKVTKAAIIGQQGGVWASSGNFVLTPEEQTRVVGLHKDIPGAQANGVRLAGKKYIVFRTEGDSVYGRQQKDGCIIVKTKMAILVAVYESPITPEECAVIVEGLADYLRSVNY